MSGDLLAAFARIAESAGKEILRHYHAGTTARLKSDRTPVTEADEAAEAVILPALAEVLPGVPCVAEEACAQSGLPSIERSGRFLLIDPLDGTREFLAGNGEFTVNIALIEGGRPTHGVVHLPVLGTTYVGGPAGAVFNEGDALDRYLEDHHVAARIAAGSSLKFCRIAEGLADLYPRFGRTMEWDTAAGHAVLVAAGGSVVTHDGQALIYGKPGFENPDFIARGRWQ